MASRPALILISAQPQCGAAAKDGVLTQGNEKFPHSRPHDTYYLTTYVIAYRNYIFGGAGRIYIFSISISISISFSIPISISISISIA